MDDRDNKNYITSRVHPIFEKMIIDLLLVKPDDLVDYMISWLNDKGSQFKVNTQPTNSTKEFQPTIKSIARQKSPTNENYPSSEEDSDDDLYEDEEENINQKSLSKLLSTKVQSQKRRESVSTEVFGLYNKRQPLALKVVQKKNEQKERINRKIQNLFLFSCLEDKEKHQLADSMEEKRLRPGEYLFKQNEQADCMYIVEQGQLDCYIQSSTTAQGQSKLVKSYFDGDSIGEQALLYIQLRSNTVIAKNDTLLWQLDRNVFASMIRESAQNKKKKHELLFSRIGLLQAMNIYEKTQISDAIRQINYLKGEYVVKQGEQGDMFFMVEEGELVALKVKIPGGEPEQVMSYKAGQYFGELALIKNQPRQASVLCKSNCKLLSLDRYSFKRLLGSAEVILKRNSDIYDSIKQ